MLDIKGQESMSKYKKNKQISIKETNTLDNKHRQMVKYFNNNKYEKEKLLEQINNINAEIKKSMIDVIPLQLVKMLIMVH